MAVHFFYTILLIPHKLDFLLRYYALCMRCPDFLTISLLSGMWYTLDRKSGHRMLDNLGSPARVFTMLLLKICVQIVYFNFFVSCAWSYSI